MSPAAQVVAIDQARDLLALARRTAARGEDATHLVSLVRTALRPIRASQQERREHVLLALDPDSDIPF